MKTNTKELKDFIATWQTQGNEVADKVTYWNTLLELLGVPKQQIENKTYIEYEKPIKLRENEKFHGSIDAYIPSTKVLIEQKSNGVDLFKAESRPNGGDTEKITPFEQAKRYDNHLGSREKANFLVLSNFNQIVIYDVRDSIDAKPVIIDLKDLKKNLYLLDFLVNPDETKRLATEKKVSIDAGELVSKIYNELANIFAKYDQVDDEKIKHSINTLCVRLVFCLYAEDAGLFATKEQFYNYLQPIVPNKIGLALKALFKVLDTKIDDRKKDDPFWEDEHPELSQFPYVNGGLFKEEDIIIPPFTPELKDIVLNQASRHFDWSNISPTIFGAVFESTLNPETRRQGGMHYTSVENIHKVIDPLFLNDLKAELEEIKQYKNQKTIKEKARAFQEKLANLTFFDPACGSGNFLTETFLSLRRLENEAIRLENSGQTALDVGQAQDWIKISIQQFYGIEINDFAVSVAKTALWIAEDQMMKETQDLLYAPDWDFLPLKTYTKIHEGNALKMDWNKVLPNYACHYVIGNPPFSGKKEQTKEQKQDLKYVFHVNKKDKSVSVLDYVCCWYKKANEYIAGTNIQVAFVSTNSISQGEQVAPLWLHLSNLSINFAWKTFPWSSEAKTKAQVHVIIVGFSDKKYARKEKFIFSKDKVKKVKEISPYIVEYLPQNIVISKHTTNIDPKAPALHYGSMPIDNGYLILNKEDVEAIKNENKDFLKFVRPYRGGKEIINNKTRWCLWLKDAKPSEFRKSKFIKDRIEKTRQFRANSNRSQTKELADIPYLFGEIRQPNSSMLVLPKVSSKNRKYIPMPFIDPHTIINGSSLMISDATTYDLGILDSIVHMAWMRTVAGRMKSDYQYSKELVYANFPWPTIDDKQKEKIEKTAQAILDARSNHPENSLADLYDPLAMPADLLKAHKANDKAVLQAYRLKPDATESEIVAHLFKMYEKLTKTK